jgi:transcriptional regulator with XRE-family HTH domain
MNLLVPISIGARLREERERLGLNQTAFGEIGRVTKKTQVLYESSERAPDANYLAAIAVASVDVLYILTGIRATNTAATPTELAYLRNCRALTRVSAQQRGLDMLVYLREAYGVNLPETESES